MLLPVKHLACSIGLLACAVLEPSFTSVPSGDSLFSVRSMCSLYCCRTVAAPPSQAANAQLLPQPKVCVPSHLRPLCCRTECIPPELLEAMKPNNTAARSASFRRILPDVEMLLQLQETSLPSHSSHSTAGQSQDPLQACAFCRFLPDIRLLLQN